MHRFLRFALVFSLAASAAAQVTVEGGRAYQNGTSLRLQAGLGSMEELSGGYSENNATGGRVGSVELDFAGLGLEGEDVSEFGLAVWGRWLGLHLNLRQSELNAQRTADQDWRLGIDNLTIDGQEFDYLLIPAGVDYTLDADMTEVSLALQLTPFTLNFNGAVTFTPWLHAGVNVKAVDYTVDAGASVGVQIPGLGERRFAVRGQADDTVTLGGAELGLGAELRFRFHEPDARGPDLVLEGNFLEWDYQGGLSDLGLDDEKWSNIDYSYTTWSLGAYLEVPVGDVMNFFAGLWMESVDIDLGMTASESARDTFDREGSLSYEVYSLRIGLIF